MASTFTTSLRSGTACLEITPPLGTQLAGNINQKRPVEKILDPLFVRVAVFENADQKLCLVTLDLTLMTRPYCDAIIDKVSELYGFTPESVMVHGTQTHSAPSFGGALLDKDLNFGREWDWISLREDEYCDFVVSQAVKAVGLACTNLQSVEIGVLSGFEGRVAFNRRGVTHEGKIRMPPPEWPSPLGSTEIRYLEGPIDPELGVLATRTAEGALNALVVNYTCHPVHLFWNGGGIVTADWPGVLCDSLQAEIGSGGLPLVVNGACGNINPWDPFDPDYVEDHQRMGSLLASSALKVLNEIQYKAEAVLDCRVRHLQIQFRIVDAAQLEADRKLLEQHPTPLWEDDEEKVIAIEWILAALRVSVHLQQQREGTLDYQIKVFRIGDTAFVGLPGEPFAEGGLQIKMASPAPFTYIAHNVSQYVGYIPVADSFKHGGHEVNLSYWAKLVPEAWEMIAQTSLSMLHELFPNESVEAN